MSDEKYFDIMNRYIDGIASKEEVDDLKKYLGSNPEDSKIYKDLFQLDKAIKNIPDVPPPADLKSNVLRSLNISGEQLKDKNSGLKNYIIPIRDNFKLKYAYSFVLGLTAGICFLVLGTGYFENNYQVNETDFSGTLLIEEEADKFSTISSDSFKLNRSQGSFTLKRLNDQILCNIEIQSDDLTLITIQYDHQLFNLNSFSRNFHTELNISLTDGRIEIAHIGNNQYYLLINRMDQKAALLKYKIITGKEIYENYVNIE